MGACSSHAEACDIASAMSSCAAFGNIVICSTNGLARRRIFHWRLAPLPFTGRGWKLRSSSQRWIRCLEKRTFDSIRRCGMSPRIPSRKRHDPSKSGRAFDSKTPGFGSSLLSKWRRYLQIGAKHCGTWKSHATSLSFLRANDPLFGRRGFSHSDQGRKEQFRPLSSS